MLTAIQLRPKLSDAEVDGCCPWLPSVLRYRQRLRCSERAPSGNMSSFVDIAGQVLKAFPVRSLVIGRDIIPEIGPQRPWRLHRES